MKIMDIPQKIYFSHQDVHRCGAEGIDDQDLEALVS